MKSRNPTPLVRELTSNASSFETEECEDVNVECTLYTIVETSAIQFLIG